MKRYYYIYNGEPWNDELKTWWLAIEGALQTHMVKLHGAGVLEGLPVTENDPTPDLNVLIGAGYAWDGYGKIIHPTATEACDCSVDKNAASTIPSSGKERYIVIAAKHDRKLSGLSTSIVGWPEAASEEVYTIDDDWYEYVVIAGTEAAPGSATVPACQADEVHLAAVLLADSTTAITDAMIDTSGRTTITNPADAIAAHVVADPAHAAAKISYDDSGIGLPGTPNDVQAAIAALAGRGLKTNQAIYNTSGSFTFTQGVDCPADVFDVFVTVIGAGGGGAGTYSGSMSPGGGAGGTAQKKITLSADEAVTVTVGAKGAGGAADSNGNNGGTSSFGAYCSANGGTGATKGRYLVGGPGGTATGGDLNITGGQGTATRYDCGGEGGGSFFADGGIGGSNNNAQGQAGQYGSGGGGARYVSSGTSGGDGGDGLIIVTWVQAA